MTYFCSPYCGILYRFAFMLTVLASVAAVSAPDSFASPMQISPAGKRVSAELFPGYGKWRRAVGQSGQPSSDRELLCKRFESRICDIRFGTATNTSMEIGLRVVNQIINQQRYVEDFKNWGIRDYWSRPNEFLAKGGDCEDFALAKYVLLRQAGMPVEHMRVLVLHDTARNVAHAVLLVATADQTLVLDNLNDHPVTLSEVPHYRPIYSLNGSAVWLHLSPREVPQLTTLLNSGS